MLGMARAGGIDSALGIGCAAGAGGTGSIVGPGGVLVDVPKIGGTTRVDLVTLRGVRLGRELRHVVLARGGVFHAGEWHLVNVHGLVVEVVRMVDDVLGIALRAVTLRRFVSMGQEAIGRWLCSG